MNENNPINDLKHIRNMMENSSRFISLSGLAGVFAGSFALIAALVAYNLLKYHNVSYYDVPKIENENLLVQLFIVGFVTLVLSLSAGILLTIRKSKKNKLPVFTKTTYKMLENLFIPLICGGIISLSFLYWNDVYYIAPATLVFYGLGLVNAAKYTFGDVKYLGLCEIALGLISFFFIGYGLWFWSIGFGVLHIVYGIIMHRKYH